MSPRFLVVTAGFFVALERRLARARPRTAKDRAQLAAAQSTVQRIRAQSRARAQRMLGPIEAERR